LIKGTTRVLVTGGAGFIGSHLVDRLVAEDFDVRVLDDLSSGCLDNIRGHVDSGRVEFVKGDVKDPEVVGECVRGVGFVVHLAAVVSVPFSNANPALTYDTNVSGTLNVLVACAKAKVSRFVFASTCAVYGEPEHLPVDEGAPCRPISPYAESKLAAERFSLGFCEKRLLDCVALRFFNVYGPRQCMNDYSGVITRFVDLARRGSTLTVYGDGSATRDFVYVGDVVDAIMLCLEGRVAVGEVFNVGTGKATSVDELAKTVLELVPSGRGVVYDKPRVGDIKSSYADVSEAERVLGFRAKTGLRDGLRVLIETGSVA
jgi:UDP-glucose 4-epimerase